MDRIEVQNFICSFLFTFDYVKSEQFKECLGWVIFIVLFLHLNICVTTHKNVILRSNLVNEFLNLLFHILK